MFKSILEYIIAPVVAVLTGLFVKTINLKKYKKLEEKYERLLKEKKARLMEENESSERKISYQIELIKLTINDIFRKGEKPTLNILGTNALGPLHQGREVLISLLKKGGSLYVLILDPNCLAFKKRSQFENDTVGRIRAETEASYQILRDISSQLDNRRQKNELRLRLYTEHPDRSLFFVKSTKDNELILDNRYHDDRGTRGLEGEMFPQTASGRTSRGFVENIKHFENLWDNSGPDIDLSQEMLV